jgi:hypothetical protein
MVLILSSRLVVGLQSGLFPSGLPTKFRAMYHLPMRGTCSVNLIILDLIIQIKSTNYEATYY